MATKKKTKTKITSEELDKAKGAVAVLFQMREQNRDNFSKKEYVDMGFALMAIRSVLMEVEV